MRGFLGGLIVAAVLSGPAQAASVHDCDETANAGNIVEPWEKNSRTFYNGQVRVAYLDTGGEPVCCSGHLLVAIPGDDNEPGGGQTCFVVSDHDTLGFMAIGFDKLSTSYDPNRGLLIAFPFERYIDGIRSTKGTAKVRVNIAKHSVTVEK